MKPEGATAEAGRQTSLAQPIEYIAWGALAIALLSTPILKFSAEEFGRAVVFAAVVSAFLVLLFHGLVPRCGATPALQILATTGSIGALAWAYVLWGPHGLHVDVFYILVIAIAGFMSGWQLSLLAAALAVAAELVTSALFPGLATDASRVGVQLLAYLAAAWLASTQARIMRRQSNELRQRNLEMAFLLQASETSSSLDLTITLPQLAQQIARGLPATFCRIYLLDQQPALDRRSPGTATLKAEGSFPLRSLDQEQSEQTATWQLNRMPNIRHALRAGAPTIFCQDTMGDRLNDVERNALLLSHMRSVCLVPLSIKGDTLGVIVVGEMRNWQRQPFSINRINLLQTMAPQVAITIQNAQLHHETQRQSDRFAVLIEVGRAVGSTIELDTLLELIHQQLDTAIPSDTYFVGLYDKGNDELDLRVLIDEGQRFPRQRVPLGEGLASWVMRTRKPVLIKSFSTEHKTLAINPIIVGQTRESESWLGAPMMVGDSVLGILAVACYRPGAFGEDDIVLLSNVAQQAALAVDNARHHAAVEDQARRDSLTGVLNNKHLHQQLNQKFGECRAAGLPLAVIMVDIDQFKVYNDTYGHVMGDEVLRRVAQTIESLIPPGSLVGRWGGEEFTIILPGSTAEDAHQVASRLRAGMSDMLLRNGNSQPIPKPTISQGIAAYPLHAASDDELIILADKALYKAKDTGRDGIMVA